MTTWNREGGGVASRGPIFARDWKLLGAPDARDAMTVRKMRP
jgi:hypothetical protein